MNYGFNVQIKRGFPNIDNPSSIITEVWHNVTGIHYRYESCGKPSTSVAFESDIHGTGMVVELSTLIGFDTSLAEIEYDSF